MDGVVEERRAGGQPGAPGTLGKILGPLSRPSGRGEGARPRMGPQGDRRRAKALSPRQPRRRGRSRLLADTVDAVAAGAVRALRAGEPRRAPRAGRGPAAVDGGFTAVAVGIGAGRGLARVALADAARAAQAAAPVTALRGAATRADHREVAAIDIA